MEKSCGITYGEALEQGFQVINIEGIISLCGIVGVAFAKPMNLLLNTIALSQAKKNLTIEAFDYNEECIRKRKEGNPIPEEESNMRKEQYAASLALIDAMISLNAKKYNPDDILKGTMLDVVVDALANMSKAGSLLSGITAIAKSDIKNAIGINHSLEGSKGKDVLTGCSHSDYLSGGDGDDTLRHTDGEKDDGKADTLEGGYGFDTYYAGDRDIVDDIDGDGKVFFDGRSLNCTATYNKETEYYENGSYRFKIFVDQYGYEHVQVHNILTGNIMVLDARNRANIYSPRGIVYSSLGLNLFVKEDKPKPTPTPNDPPVSPNDPPVSPNDPPVQPNDPPGTGTRPEDPDANARWDPLALDLNHNGKIDTIDLSVSKAFFDIDENDGGIRENMGWLGEGDGFLVQDLNNNGNIDGISELFGNFTTNAFDDLKARIDSNNDGIIDANDDLFHTLQVWIDKNGNGTTEEGEFHSLESLGITSIDTNKTLHTIWDGTNNIVNSTSTYTQDGEQQLAGGMNFEVDQTVTKSEGPIAIEDLFNPILRGFGDVKDSIVVMNENPDFRSLIKEMAAGIQ